MPSHISARWRIAGFTLTELAVVLLIVGLLLGGAMFTLSAQMAQRDREETKRRLESSRDLLVAFALVNARLPCPAPANATGDEGPADVNGCGSGADVAYYAGFLPGRAIGAQPVDGAGYALDAWGNRIRYAVSKSSPTSGPGRFTTRHVANTAQAWDMSRTPDDIQVCDQAVAGTNCPAANQIAREKVVVAIVFSTGRNGAQSPTGANELENQDGDAIFVDRTPDSPGAAGGEFDDMVVWLPVGVLYSRMAAAGILP